MSRPERRYSVRRRLLEWSVIGVIIAVLAAIGTPQLLGAREKARTSVVDNIYVALNGEVANSLDAASSGRTASGPLGLDDAPNREGYDAIDENDWVVTAEEALSTFGVDVDTASYSNLRRILESGRLPPKDAVRIEELVNYFDYDYAEPTDGHPFAVHVDVGAAPWAPEHRLTRIALKGREVEASERGPSNLVFLVDVSGSMGTPDKLPLVRRSLEMLTAELGAEDRIAMVVYAGASGVVLEPTPGSEQRAIRRAIRRLESGGGTNGGAGIELAYRLAREHFVEGGVNRVLLATDGDFNVGISDRGSLIDLIRREARSGVFLTVLGFGTGNLQDSQLEQIANQGNGHYAYIDSMREAHKVLVEDLAGTLVTIAKDVKVQVEFNPAAVAAYRLIGYENRLLEKEDFNDDRKDAGEIGAGHRVTALYELVPAGSPLPQRRIEPHSGIRPPVDGLRYQKARDLTAEATDAEEWLTVKLRYKAPDGARSTRLEYPLSGDDLALDGMSGDFRFAAGVAAFGMVLRESPHRGDADLDTAVRLVKGGLGDDPTGRRHELVSLIETARGLRRIAEAREAGELVVPEGAESLARAPGVPLHAPSMHVMATTLANHIDEDNPHNRNQRAYISGGPEVLAPGQVGLVATDSHAITFYQWVTENSTHPRSFTITID